MSQAHSRVFLAGAGGRTGRLVLEKLRSRGFPVTGLVRRREQKEELGEEVCVIGDALKPETYVDEFAKAKKLVILTSAVPKMRPRSNPSDPPEFYFESGEEPEQVDWIGQRTFIDLAKTHGFDQVVLVSSMGVTKPDHPLNRLGDGNILLWKRMAEEYLVCSGLGYTILHPGGLLDKEGGKRQLIVGKNDEFLDEKANHPRTVPRADVAEVVVQALLNPEALNKSFDLVSLEEGAGSPTLTDADFDILFDQTTAGL